MSSLLLICLDGEAQRQERRRGMMMKKSLSSLS
jgi:hypothetical protein